MFSIAELQKVITCEAFKSDRRSVERTLVTGRLRRLVPIEEAAEGRLGEVVEAVLASAPHWPFADRSELCTVAGTIAEALSACSEDGERASHQRFRASLLYELAGKSAFSRSLLCSGDAPGPIGTLLRHEAAFERLSSRATDFSAAVASASPWERALTADIAKLAAFAQGEASDLAGERVSGSAQVAAVARILDIGLSASEVSALRAIVLDRYSFATKALVDDVLFEALRTVGFPAELWPAQAQAVQAGLLDARYDAWGLAAPTGSGESFITRLLLVDLFNRVPDAKAVYLVPSRALVSEVTSTLQRVLKRIDRHVLGISPQLTTLTSSESQEIVDASVVVLTPEKADLLLRLNAEFLPSVRLVIVDEAHHIEGGTRGVLLELYLWRLMQTLRRSVRYIFLSAVAPNIEALAKWVGASPRGLVVRERPTRMRVGVFDVEKRGKRRVGVVKYHNGPEVELVEKPERAARDALVQLVHALGTSGSVLIVAKGKRECETLAGKMRDWLRASKVTERTDEEAARAELRRLDSRLERELYESVELRSFLKWRVAYHHAGLPPRIRAAVEEAVREGLIDVVFATTTLAEGVNFPFATVIVQSLALRSAPTHLEGARYHPITPRSFWNIAGRAGRPGYDREGQVILFGPSLGLEQINAVLDPYLDSSLSGGAPVESALAHGLVEIAKAVQSNNLSLDDISNETLPETLAANIQGTINTLRVGVAHARAAKLVNAPEEILTGTFAATFLSSTDKRFAEALLARQGEVVDAFLARPGAPSAEVVAQLGLSIQTLSDLMAYAAQLEDWQLQGMHSLFYGGTINSQQVRYVVGPVAKRMAELEGPTLGGFLSDIIVRWLSGGPLATVQKETAEKSRLARVEDLVSVVYSRIQYLLPWGLFATDRIVASEAEKRGINYGNEIANLAFLADAGVPSFDALHLVHMDFERVDATRLAREFQRRGGLGLGFDILGWLKSERLVSLEHAIRGSDRRPIDFDFRRLLAELGNGDALRAT